MRLSGFVVGTVVGALTARYFMRGGRVSQLIPGIAGIGTGLGKAVGQIKFGHAAVSDSQGAGLGQVNEILNQDPKVKAQVSEILKQNGEKTAELQ
ncbi:hypothetical protein [Gorillibacterium timonense]|uniref:hypothetical protein n=1 Tax=Gorillibacterium timonense TaxID=1689269 RepID=UPI00071DF0A1|nr:hypothetical protein [Gorillibacterium timonense]